MQKQGAADMAESLNYILVQTVVKRAIRELKTDPERTIRNLVDMALNFSDSRFQAHFFSSAQRILSNENSGYYKLVRDTITKIDEETLLTFSMNLGYHGLYRAAVQIREWEANHGYNVPWTIFLTIAEGKLYDRHFQLIDQGEALGIHSWHLFSQNGIHECLNLASRYPQSAFVIFCGSHEIDWNVLDCITELKNVALMVPFDAEADVTCSLLREAGVLYGLYFAYCSEDLERIESGELMQEMQQLKPNICILNAQFPCEQKLRRRVGAWVAEARMEQGFQTIPWELYSDTMLADEVISEDPCWVGFDAYGQLNTENGISRDAAWNIFKNDLPFILKQAFPKQKGINKSEP